MADLDDDLLEMHERVPGMVSFTVEDSDSFAVAVHIGDAAAILDVILDDAAAFVVTRTYVGGELRRTVVADALRR